MRRFAIEVVVRPDGGTSEDYQSETCVTGTIEAVSGHYARRGICEIMWRRGWLVSRFVKVETVEGEVER